jgi:hypothetical protein
MTGVAFPNKNIIVFMRVIVQDSPFEEVLRNSRTTMMKAYEWKPLIFSGFL